MDIDASFKLQEEKHEAFKVEVKKTFEICKTNHHINDDRYKEVTGTLRNNKEAREDITQHIEDQQQRITDVQYSLKESIDSNFKRLWDFTEDVEKSLMGTLEVQKKTI